MDTVSVLITGTEKEHEAFGWDPRSDPATFVIPRTTIDLPGVGSAMVRRRKDRVYAEVTFAGDPPPLGDWQELVIAPIRYAIGAD